MRARARAREARENQLFSVILNVGQNTIGAICPKWQLEISTLFTIYSAAGPDLGAPDNEI